MTQPTRPAPDTLTLDATRGTSGALAGAGLLAGLGLSLVVTHLAGRATGALLLAAAGVLAAWALRTRPARAAGEWALALVPMTATILAVFTVYGLSFYVRFPADFLGFWEGDYLNDLLEWRAGLPLYGPVQDNTSSVYTPGAQLLTYGIGRLAGVELSVVGLRTIQFSYVFVAALVATSATDLLARRFLSPQEYAARPLWLAAWFPLLVLVCLERDFNLNVHTLHPDSFTLLLSAGAFWLLARHALRPSPLVVVGMALLPAVGFWAKQSLVIWLVLFGGYLFLAGRRWRELVLFGALAPIFLAVSIAVLFRVGGPDTQYWVFGILGGKAVGLARSANAFLAAGGFVALSLAGLCLLVLRDRTWPALLLWLVPFGLLLLQCYTTGIGWQKNHLGPGVLMAACFGLAALPRLWHRISLVPDRPVRAATQLAFGLGVGLVAPGLGLVREPKNKLPPEALAQVRAIEQEFEGMDARRVLLDRGSWVYVRDGVIMKDRASSVQLHLGANSPRMNLEAIQSTLARIRARAYDKILVRTFPQGNPYDWHSRGSGIPEALAEHYVEVRRIPGVPEVDEWWPKRLLAPIAVLVPRPDSAPALPAGAP